jgi:integral membrane protein (TIGR00529 family)
MYEIPAIIKIFAIFALILLLGRFKLQLSLSIFIGSLILGFWMGMGTVDWLTAVFSALLNAQTIGLILIIWLILIMSRMMKESGHMERLVSTFTVLSKDTRTVGAFMAAFIGLLPMPGGALFSAPMVETALSKQKVNQEQKTLVNYWFRHLWEYWWPLYPGVVLAVALLEVETWIFMAVMAPMTVLSVLAGIIFILRPMGTMGNPKITTDFKGGMRAFLWEAMPILVVVMIIVLQTCLIRILGLFGIALTTSGALSIIPGLVGSLIWVWIVNHYTVKQFLSSATDRGVLPMLFLIGVIMIFKEVLSESQAVTHIRDELMTFGIPVILVILLMPFISGMITGIALGFVGASFPIIIPLIDGSQIFHYVALAGLAYAFGFMGMMLSPVHLCFLVSKDYYHANFFMSYRLLAMPVLFVLISGSILYMLTRFLF